MRRTIALLMLLSLASQSSAWWDASFPYRTQVNISSSAPLSDHQVNISLNTQALVLAGKMRSDCGDLRITNSTDATLSYWIESGCNTNATKIWIKAPTIPAGTSTIYAYYGNPSAPAASDGTAVFVSFGRVPEQGHANNTTSAKWLYWHYDGSGSYGTHTLDDTGQTTSVSTIGAYSPGSGSNSLRWQAAGSDQVYEYSGIEETHDEVMHLTKLNVPASGNYTLGFKYYYSILQLYGHPSTGGASVEASSFVSPLPTSGWNQGDWYEVLHSNGLSNLNTPSSFPSNYTVSRELNASNIGGKDARGTAVYSGLGVRCSGSNNGQWCYSEIKVDMALSYSYIRKYASPAPSATLGTDESLDVSAPSVQIQSPTSQEYNTSTISVNFTATDNIAVSSCTVRLNGTVNSSTCSNYTLTLGNGAYLLNVSANDTSGNTNSSQVSFNVSVSSQAQSSSSPQISTISGIADGNVTFTFTPASLRLRIGVQDYPSKTLRTSAGVNKVQIRTRVTSSGQIVTDGTKVTYTLSE